MTASSSDLCKSCGFCCNGLSFRFVPVNEREAEMLASLGMTVNKDETGWRFQQPCFFFRDGCCHIYGEHPSICREYKCKLLKAFQISEIDRETATERIRKAKELTEHLASCLVGYGTNLPLSEKIEAFKNRARTVENPGAFRQVNAEVFVQLASLRFLLWRVFFCSTKEGSKTPVSIMGPDKRVAWQVL